MILELRPQTMVGILSRNMLAGAAALAGMALAGFPTVARADGGTGGGSGFVSQGGGGGAGYSGGVGSSGVSALSSGNGGGGGGGGAAGGGSGGQGGAGTGGTAAAGGSIAAPTGIDGADQSANGNGSGGGGGGAGGLNGTSTIQLINVVPLAGSAGGAGGAGGATSNFAGGGGGGGGAGGFGAVVTGNVSPNSNTSSISGNTGGTGGAGGDAALGFSGNGGTGGGGGGGIVFSGSSPTTTFDNGTGATVTGGQGGTGGAAGTSNNSTSAVGSSGAGGAGGAGVTAANGLTLSNEGTITGGTGGAAGTAAAGGLAGTAGVGGTGIVGSGLTVINSGAITGGLSGDGVTRANAITFTGGSNFLDLSGGTLIGNIGVTGSLTFNQAVAVSLPNVITGSGAVFDSGTGTLKFSGANTYTGGTTVSTGTLQLAGAGTLGATSGAVRVSGGTLDLGGTMQTQNGGLMLTGGTIQNGTLSSSATFVIQSGTVNAVLTGTGGVTKSTAGTVTLSGVNTYSGVTTVNGGTLALAAGGAIAGSVLNNASFTSSGTVSGGLTNTGIVNANGGQINGPIANNAGTFNVAGTVTSNGTFGIASGATLAVGGTGLYTLQGLLTNAGFVTVASGGQLIATAAGITNAVGGSIIVAAGGTVHDDLNNAGIVTNSGAYFANVASNTGTITNNGTWTGTISTGGAFSNAAGATVSGLLTNTAGIATDNGALNGGAVITGGALTGAGSVTNLTATGGALAPGNGTPGSSMTIRGSLALSSGAFYLVQINPSTSSFANVTGTATLGGATVNAIYANGSYVTKQYTILTAGSVSGTFNPAVVNTNLPSDFHTTLSYDTHDAYLNLALNFGIPGGLNGNQQNVGNALTNFFNATGSIPIVFGALTPAALTQASGETATGSQQTTFDAMNQFMGVMTDPFIAGRGDGFGASGGAPSGYASTQKTGAARDANAMFVKAPVVPFEQRWSTWTAGFGGSQTTEGSAAVGSNSTTSSIVGTAVGADYRLSPYTLAGFALAGGGTNFSVVNGGSGRSDLFQAGAFIRHNAGAAYFSGALAYGWQDITTNRIVTVAGFDQLRADFNANAFSGRAEGGYRLVAPWTGGVGITPYAAGQFTTFDLPAYAEQAVVGANTFALAYGAESVTDTRSEIGLRSDKSFAMQDGIFALRGRVAWAHDFDPDRSIGVTFQTLPGASFLVNGAAQATNSALVTASAEKNWLNGWSAAATFEGEFSNVTTSYAGKGVVRYSF